MRKDWGLGERIFKDDVRRRMMLYRYLLIEVLGQKLGREREELEVLQKKYIKWSLGLDTCTSDYKIYKEMDKIRITAGYRAMKFEEKALKGDNRRLLIECIEVREKEKSRMGWMGEKRIFTDKID